MKFAFALIAVLLLSASAVFAASGTGLPVDIPNYMQGSGIANGVSSATASVPAVSLTSPSSMAVVSGPTLTFKYKYFGPQAATCTGYLNGKAFSSASTSPNAAGTLTATGVVNGTYNWHVICSYRDGDGILTSISSPSRGLTVGAIPVDAPTGTVSDAYVSISSPQNSEQVPQSSVLLLFSYIGPSATCNVFVDAKSIANVSVSSGQQISVNSGKLADGSHTWQVFCSRPGPDNIPVVVKSAPASFTVNTSSAQSVMLTSPTDGAALSSSTVELTYAYNPGSLAGKAVMCNVYLDGNLVDTKPLSPQTGGITVVHGVSNGNHTWYVDCSDPLASTGNPYLVSKTFSFTVNSSSAQSDAANVTLSFPQNGASSATAPQVFGYTYYSGKYGPSSAMCVLYIDGNQAGSTRSSSGSSATIPVNSASIAPGTHSWQVVCGSTPSATWTFNVGGANGGPRVELLAPADGLSTSSTTVAFSLRYHSGNAPKNVSCYMLIDGTVRAGFTADDNVNGTSVTLSNLAQGTHNWSVRCENADSRFPIFSQVRTFTIGAVNGPQVLLISPDDGATIQPGNTDLIFRYAANGGPSTAVCLLSIDGLNGGSRLASNGADAAFSSTKTAQAGIHAWSVTCNDAQGAAIATSAQRTFTVSSTPVVPPSGPGGNGGSGGSGGSGTGGGAVTPRKATTATATTNNTLGGTLPLVNTTVEKPKVLTAILAAPIESFVNQTVQLILKAENGKPISSNDVYVRVPNSTLSIRITTDSLGRASYVPTAAGIYTYRATGYTLSGAPTTVVSEPEAAAPEKQKGLNIGEILNYLIIFIGIVAVIGILISGYLMLTQKKDEEQ